MELPFLKNANDFNHEKKTLIFISGLNVNIEDYGEIYENYTDSMNVILITINQYFMMNYYENIDIISNYLKSLGQKTLYFISHSYGCIILYNISSKINEIEKICVLLEPTCIESINPIQNNKMLREDIKDLLIRQIYANKTLKDTIENQKTLLITQLQLKKFKLDLNAVNKIRDKFNNYDNFFQLFQNYHTLKRLNEFNEIYSTSDIHYVVLPLEETKSKILPHFIYAHAPREIIYYSNIMFNLDDRKGGKKKYKKRYTKTKKHKKYYRIRKTKRVN